jgi:hypothetical protein
MTQKNPNKAFQQNHHMHAALIRPYVDGARVQLERYIEARAWCKHNPIDGINRCYYEASSLFEHLATVARHFQLIGLHTPQGQLYIDVRNHIRHDVREEFDQDTKKKSERAKRLGLNPKLQLDLSFLDDGVKIGSTELHSKAVSTFIEVSSTTVHALMAGMMVEVIDGQFVAKPKASADKSVAE